MYYSIAKRILYMSLKFCIVMYKYYGPVAFNCKIKYLHCIVLYCIVEIMVSRHNHYTVCVLGLVLKLHSTIFSHKTMVCNIALCLDRLYI